MSDKLRKILITFSFSFVLLFISLTIPTNFASVMPGTMSEVSSNIKIDGVENAKNIYTTSVYYQTRMVPLIRMILEADNKNDIYPMTPYESSLSSIDDYKMGQISKKYSYYSSIINAYKEASKVDSSITINYEVDGLLLYYRPSRMIDLQIGDHIIKIDGVEVNEDNYKEVIRESRKDNLPITIKREDQIIEYVVKYTKDDPTYISFYPNIVVSSSNPSFELPGLDSTTGGPSGGLMQTINIYVSLLNLNLGDLKIGGTGTLNLDGNVEKIGGAVQKIHTANAYKMDVFFIALSNHSEVVELKKDFDYYPVENLAEAIQILNTKIIK